MATNLYKYLPSFLRLRDTLYSANIRETGTKPILERLVELVAEEFDETHDFITGIKYLNDPDVVDPQYFMHLSFILGTMIGTQVDETLARWLIKNLVYVYKIKGTQPSWRLEWRRQATDPPEIIELWKTIPNEVGDYTEQQDIDHPLKSARVDFGFCQTSCESFCESSCESFVETPVLVSREEARRYIAMVEAQRPIHVLLRTQAVILNPNDQYAQSGDTIGPYAYASGLLTNGSGVVGYPIDAWGNTLDHVDIQVTCESTCETACQGCCEIQCECDACESNCQAGSCQLACTATCEFTCEWACECSCQFGCTAAGAEGPGECLSICQTSCQDQCQTECMVKCQTTCQTLDCQTSVEQ